MARHGIVISIWSFVPQQEEKGLGAAIVNAKRRGAKAKVCIVDISSSCRLSVSLAGQQRERGLCCRLARTTCVEMGRTTNGIDCMCACSTEIHMTDERWSCIRLVRSKEVTSYIKHPSLTFQNRNLLGKSLLMDHVCQK